MSKTAESGFGRWWCVECSATFPTCAEKEAHRKHVRGMMAVVRSISSALHQREREATRRREESAARQQVRARRVERAARRPARAKKRNTTGDYAFNLHRNRRREFLFEHMDPRPRHPLGRMCDGPALDQESGWWYTADDLGRESGADCHNS